MRDSKAKPQTKASDTLSEKRKHNSLADDDRVQASDNVTESTLPISAQEEADLSSALIARLLAEETGGGGGQYSSYYNDYANGAYDGDMADEYVSQSEGDDDWDPSRKKRRTAKVGKTRRRQSNIASGYGDGGSEGSESDSSNGTDQRKSRRAKKASNGRMKEKAADSPIAPGQYRSGAYTDEEEGMFRKGLELFGRSWAGISEYVGTRDPKSIRSHAQKYFIKLFRDKVPLPAKVLESGEGYTLSGKPLDPNSAAARPYLQHTMQLDPPTEKTEKTHNAGNKHTETCTQDATSLPKSAECLADNKNNHTAEITECSENPNVSLAEPQAFVDSLLGPVANMVTEDRPSEAGQQEQTSRQADDRGANRASSDTPGMSQADAKTKETTQAESGSEQSTVVPNSPVRTEYAMSRPQRIQARTVALRYNDPHQMVRCTPFPGQPLSTVLGCQPFRVVVHTNAQVQMDLHAHLMLSEVIGFLGGVWDAKSKVVTVVRAFPCAALETNDAHTNVEMDPGSELVVRHQIMDAGLRVVGWYHSHPTFRPDPSIIDIENQTAYQKLFRDSGSAEEPFVGAIVGPYDAQLPGPISVLNWFYVGRSAIDRGHPKRLMVERRPDRSMSSEEREILLGLVDTASSLEHHAALEEAWRPSSTELRLLKMMVSLTHRMPWLVEPKDGVSTEPNAAAMNNTDDPISSEATRKSALLENKKTETSVLAEAVVMANEGVDSACADACSGVAVHDPQEKLGAGDDSSDCAHVDMSIPQEYLLAGQRAVRDPLIAALCTRFSAGIFKSGTDGKVADPKALERVFAAYFNKNFC